MLRPRVRAFLLAVIATFALASPAAAGEFRSDQRVTIDEGESIDDDLYAAGGTITIDGTVNGDATVAGGIVQVDGTVTGSLNVGGGTVEVSGDVTGAVRVSGGTVRISGSVGRDVVVFGGTVSIEESADITGDVAGGVGTLAIEGSVGGDVLAGAGTMVVSGSVDGSIEVGVTELTIEADAVIGGDVTYTSVRDATIDPDAQIGGEVTRQASTATPDAPVIPDNPIVTYLGVLLGMLLLGWAMLAVRPRFTLGSTDVLRGSPLLALGVGLGSLVGQFLILAILAVAGALVAIFAASLGGAFVAIAFVVLLLIVLAVILSVVPIALVIGRLILRERSPYLAYLLGAAILSLVVVGLGYLPVLGGVLFLVVWILGLGAFVVYAWRTREQPYVLEEAPAA